MTCQNCRHQGYYHNNVKCEGKYQISATEFVACKCTKFVMDPDAKLLNSIESQVVATPAPVGAVVVTSSGAVSMKG